LFIEPEGWKTIEIYLNGFSSSLPEDIQYKALTKVPGLEKVKIFRPGYAIEYDYFPPTQLDLTLETKIIKNLYFAGQINGTTGYEEAACQGLMAGINAHHKIAGKAPFVLKRSEAYIGVLIDDLVTKGTDEPYRMFTSRAEYRILLRQDNADIRLTPIGYGIGLASKERYDAVLAKMKFSHEIIKFFKNESIDPSEINTKLTELGSSELAQKTKLFSVLSRPQVNITDIISTVPRIQQFVENYNYESVEQAEILMKYEGYIAKEQDMAEKMQRLENIRLHEDLDYSKLSSLSAEAREKLIKIKPQTIGQASRISGVTPSDISILMIYLGR
jgi:tRNA uridine 5-carboxymethylaminomethyl modification enzyme